MKRFYLVIVLLLFALAAPAGWWLYITIGRPGAVTGATDTPDPSRMNALERWCAEQLRRIADDLLSPKLKFDALRLQLPATATLSNVSLTSDDVTIIEMTSMQLEFSEMPKKGRPLVIKSATFTDPQVRLIGRAEGGFTGFSGFMKSTEGKVHEDGVSSKPSDFLAIRHIAISNGMLEWAPVGYDHPMRLQELSMDLATTPDAVKPGMYAFNMTIERDPIMDLTWDGGLSIDTGDLDFDDVTLNVHLDEGEYQALTPQVQDFLRQYQIVDAMTLDITGRVPLMHPEATDLQFDASLRDANAVVGEFHFPVDSAEMTATFKDMRFTYDPLTVNAFSGRIDSSGFFDFSDTEPFSVKVDVADVLIQDMLRKTSAEEPQFAGRIVLTTQAQGAIQSIDTTMQGGGRIDLTEGRLVNLSLFNALADKLLVSDKRPKAATDTASAEFTLKGDRLTIDSSKVETTTAAGSGKGDIFYDGRLDLLVNAGSIKKVESLLGKVGDIVGMVTDRLLPFRVTGTLAAPVVTPQPLGLPIGGNSDGMTRPM